MLNSSKPIAHFHRSAADRVAAANLFVKEVNFFGEVVCDTMANDVFERYDSHPERICIIVNGRVVHEGGKGPMVYYDIESVITWLKERDVRAEAPSSLSSEKDQETEEAECST